MRKYAMIFGLVLLLAGLVCLRNVGAQMACVKQSGPKYKWCSGPHEFHVDVTAKVHTWLFAYLESTRIHYEVYKPGCYYVKKRLYAISNEPIYITVTGVQDLVHLTYPNEFPKLHHWAGLCCDGPMTENEIHAITDPLLADIDGGTQLDPRWTPLQELVPIDNWAPGYFMPQEVYNNLQLAAGPAGDPQENMEGNGMAPMPSITLDLTEQSDYTTEDELMLQLVPQQFGDGPITTCKKRCFIRKTWLCDGICVGFCNRACKYADPDGYIVTVTANPYCKDDDDIIG